MISKSNWTYLLQMIIAGALVGVRKHSLTKCKVMLGSSFIFVMFIKFINLIWFLMITILF